MACGRLLQLGKPVTRTALAELAPVWCRSFTSFSQSAMETYVPASSHELGAQAMASSGDVADAVVCGRGDKKTKRGKRFKGSFGNCREQRGTTTRRHRRGWQLSYDPLLPVHAQPFPLSSLSSHTISPFSEELCNSSSHNSNLFQSG